MFVGVVEKLNGHTGVDQQVTWLLPLSIKKKNRRCFVTEGHCVSQRAHTAQPGTESPPAF